MKKKRNIIIAILSILLIPLLIIISILLYNKHQEDELKKDILSHYGEIVKLNGNTFLYDKDNKNVVSVYKGLTLELDKVNDKIDEYFKLKNHDLYVKYSDVEKVNKLENYDIYNDLFKYPNKNYNVKMIDNSIFYQNDRKLFSKKIDDELNVVMEDESNYYVIYNEIIYQVKKEEVVKNEIKDKVSYLENLSVFYFDDLYLLINSVGVIPIYVLNCLQKKCVSL